jgi:hypothetical protein
VIHSTLSFEVRVYGSCGPVYGDRAHVIICGGDINLVSAATAAMVAVVRDLLQPVTYAVR